MSKTLSTIQMQLNDVLLLNGAADPTAGGGVVAPIGSKYWRGTGTAGDFTKTGAASTAWTAVAQGIYFNVKDPAYGAAGDGVTDDRSAIQKAIDDASVIGGTIYFPPGTYRCGKNGANSYSFLLENVENVRFLGTGWGGSVLKQSGDAAGGAYNLFQLHGTTDSIEFELLTFDQSGLVNPLADACHLLYVIEASVVKVNTCRFTGGVATAGAYVKVGGVAGEVAEIVWINDCIMSDAGGPSIWIDGGASVVWIIDNDLVNTTADDQGIFVDDSTGDGIEDVKIQNNNIQVVTHYAIFIGGSGASNARFQIQNNAVAGFVHVENLAQSQLQQNTIFGAIAGLADPVLSISDSTEIQVQKSVLFRETTAAPGLVLSLDGCARVMCQGMGLTQQTENGVLYALDCTNIQIQNTMVGCTDAGASAHDCYLFEAATVSLDNLQVTNPTIRADAGTWTNAIHVLSSGQTIGVVQVVPGVLDNCATGVNFDDGGGGIGMFSQPGLLMVAGGIIDASVAAWTVPSGIYLRVAGNCSPFGPNIISGTGSPENNVTARVGSQYLRLDGGAGTSLYIKESGSGNTGWIGK